MTHHDDMAFEETEDRFYAQFDSRDVKLMTLDELTEAFDAGLIHENTFVCREGESEWLTLAVVAGLGEGEEEEPEPAPPSVVVSERRPPMPQRTVELAPSVASESRPPMPERRPAMHTMPATRMQQSVAPSVVPVVSSTPLSFAPVASNIDYDLDDLALRPKRRWGRVLAAAAALTLVGGGAAFALGGGAHAVASAVPSLSALEAAGNKTQASLTLDSVQTKPSEAPAAPAPAPAAAPDPVAAVAPTPAADVPSSAPGLSDDMKAALLAQDKTHAAKHASKVKARAASAGSVAHHGKAASSAGLKSGGSAYDPLNGKL